MVSNSQFGHLILGFVIFINGLWHLFNHTKLLALKGPKYKSLPIPWFPCNPIRHLELYLLMFVTFVSIIIGLFVNADRHNPFDPDGTIPSNLIINFEHISMLLLFFVHASSSLAFDTLPRRRFESDVKILQLVAVINFTQQLFLFHLHSIDHTSIEGRYHLFLQLVVAVVLVTTILEIAMPTSFIVSYVRSLSFLSEGAWIIVIGFMQWTPSLISKGCFLNLEGESQVIRCDGQEMLHRAKSLVNVGFSWFLIGVAVFAVLFYSVMMSVYGNDDVDYAEVDQVDDLDAGIHRLTAKQVRW